MRCAGCASTTWPSPYPDSSNFKAARVRSGFASKGSAAMRSFNGNVGEARSAQIQALEARPHPCGTHGRHPNRSEPQRPGVGPARVAHRTAPRERFILSMPRSESPGRPGASTISQASQPQRHPRGRLVPSLEFTGCLPSAPAHRTRRQVGRDYGGCRPCSPASALQPPLWSGQSARWQTREQYHCCRQPVQRSSGAVAAARAPQPAQPTRSTEACG